MRNDDNGEVILQTQRTEDIPTAFGTLFGTSIACNLFGVKESLGPFKVEGYISNAAHPLKNLQFIYINKRLLLKTKIHKLVNSLLSRSAILKSNNVPYAPISKEINHSLFLAYSPPKRDKHAVFVLNVTCPLSEYDITLDPKKTLVEFCNWDCILSCFENLLRKFIEREAGHSSSKDNCFDSEPPRKIKSVMDEINLLAREDAIGAEVQQTSDESISTKNLPRAIHCLPANRCPVNLSPVPSTECFLSTSSSDIFSSAADGKQTIYSSLSYPGSVFTEKPYPALAHGSTTQYKEKIKPRKQPLGWTETECSGTSRYSVEPLKCLFKRPETSAGTKPVKGFIPDPIYFQEKRSDFPHRLSVKSSEQLVEAAASPLNALASIKEIRRKKLLSNLNKFSFNITSEKPVLLKTALAPYHAQEIAPRFTDNLQTLNDKHQNSFEKLPANKLKESRAVQTSFTPTNFESAEDTFMGTSLMAFADSCTAPSSICAENGNTPSSLNSCLVERTFCRNEGTVCKNDYALKCRDINVLKILENKKKVNLHLPYKAPNNSKVCEKLKNQKELEGAFSNFWAVHDTTCVEGDVESVGTFTISKSSNSISQESDSKFEGGNIAFGVAPLRNHPVAFGACSSNDSIGCNLDVFQCTNTDPGQKTLSKKIVDYDSSPCSSQETLTSAENLIQSDISSCVLKRKHEKQDEFLKKKVCSSPVSNTSEMPSPQDIDGMKETFNIDHNEPVHARFSSEQDPSNDMCSSSGLILSNSDMSPEEIISAEHKNINPVGEMEEVVCQELVSSQHPSADDHQETKKHQVLILMTCVFFSFNWC